MGAVNRSPASQSYIRMAVEDPANVVLSVWVFWGWFSHNSDSWPGFCFQRLWENGQQTMLHLYIYLPPYLLNATLYALQSTCSSSARSPYAVLVWTRCTLLRNDRVLLLFLPPAVFVSVSHSVKLHFFTLPCAWFYRHVSVVVRMVT